MLAAAIIGLIIGLLIFLALAVIAGHLGTIIEHFEAQRVEQVRDFGRDVHTR